MLVTSSGLNLTNESFPKGLHVGSYKNKIFKIAILKTAVPKIYFLDEKKIDTKIRKGHCRFVAAYVDPNTGIEVSWNSLAKDQPISFCIGIRDINSVDRLTNDFREHLGLDQYLLIQPEQGETPAALFIFSNSFVSAAKLKGWMLPSTT